jgi:hypothetical protein
MGEVWTRYGAVMRLRDGMSKAPLPPRPFRSLLQLQLLPLHSLPPPTPAGMKLGNDFRKFEFERDADTDASLELELLLDQSE